MNIFGMGLPEMILIFVVALLIFGPKKLPEIGKTLGKTLRGFQDASKEFEAEFKKEAERLNETFQETTATMEAELEHQDRPQLEQGVDEGPLQQPAKIVAETPQGTLTESSQSEQSSSVTTDPT